jgi:hypothetical protein
MKSSRPKGSDTRREAARERRALIMGAVGKLERHLEETTLEEDAKRSAMGVFWWVAVLGTFWLTTILRDDLVLLAMWQAVLAGFAGAVAAAVVASGVARFTEVFTWSAFRVAPGAPKPRLWWALGIIHLLCIIILLLLPSLAVGRIVSLGAVPVVAGQYPSLAAVIDGLR